MCVPSHVLPSGDQDQRVPTVSQASRLTLSREKPLGPAFAFEIAFGAQLRSFPVLLGYSISWINLGGLQLCLPTGPAAGSPLRLLGYEAVLVRAWDCARRRAGAGASEETGMCGNYQMLCVGELGVRFGRDDTVRCALDRILECEDL